MRAHPKILAIIAAALVAIEWTAPARAGEVIRDGSTGSLPAGSLTGPNFQVLESHGTLRGQNLFHSFQEFNLDSNESATFSATSPVSNVISRVTGGNASTINGRLESNIPGADFYFLNPAGVMFGPGAVTNVQGALHVSTASQVNFSDGSFSAVNPQTISTGALTTTPQAFGFLGTEIGTISIDGGRDTNTFKAMLRASGVTDDEIATLTDSQIKQKGLALLNRSILNDDDTALLAGGVTSGPNSDISLSSKSIEVKNGGYVRAPYGDVRVVSQAGVGSVDPRFGRTTNIGALGSVMLDGALISSSNAVVDLPSGGAIHQKSGGIESFSQTLTVNNSLISSAVGLEETSPIDDRTSRPIGSILLSGAVTRIDSSTVSTALAGRNNRPDSTGSIDLVGIGGTSSVFLAGSTFDTSAEIAVINGLGAPTGDVRIFANDIHLFRGTNISTRSSYYDGASGSVIVGDDATTSIGINDPADLVRPFETSDRVSISASNFAGLVGPVFESGVERSGSARGGNVELRARQIGSSGLDATASGRGRYGAGEIRILGGDSIVLAESSLEARTVEGNLTPTRNTGEIEVSAPVVMVSDSSFLGGTAGLPKGSTIRLNGTRSLSVHGIEVRTSSGIGRSRSGDVFLSGGDVLISDSSARGGTVIRAGTTTSEDAGDVTISGTKSIILEHSQLSTDSAIVCCASNFGNAGTIRLAAPKIQLKSGSVISSETATNGSAGDIILSGDTVSIDEGSRISTASTIVRGPNPNQPDVELAAGNPGSITLDATRDLDITGEVTTNALEGPAVDSTGQLLDPTAVVGGNIRLSADDYFHLGKTGVISSSVGTGKGGSIEIGLTRLDATTPPPELVEASTPDRAVIESGASITATAVGFDDDGNAVDSSGGRIDINASSLFLSPSATISANAGQGTNGIVNINSPDVNIAGGLRSLSTQFTDASALFSPACSASTARKGSSGSFVVARRKGLPLSPEGLLLAFEDVPPADLLPAVSTSRTAFETKADAKTAEAGQQQVTYELAQLELERGVSAFRGGKLSEASESWRAASEIFESRGAAAEASRAYRLLAQTQQAQGLYEDSLLTLRKAVAAAEQTSDSEQLALALGSLGNAHVALGQPKLAVALLQRGLGLALNGEDTRVAGGLANNLGNQQSVMQDYRGALESYRRSAKLAAEAGNALQEAKAWSNAARAAVDLRDPATAFDLGARAQTLMKGLETSREKAFLAIHVARTFARVAEDNAARRPESLVGAFQSLQSARSLGAELSDPATTSYAFGNLGELYQLENRTDEALYYTRKAIAVAEKHEIDEALTRWYWQEGRLLWSLGRAEDGLRSLEKAVAILEETRPETLSQYGDGSAHFRRSVAPIYLELVRKLLDGADLLSRDRSNETMLVAARNTIEKFKAAELRDYMRDECVAQLEGRQVDLSEVSTTAALVYPILLADRLELLVNFPNGLERYTVRVPSSTVENTVQKFRSTLDERIGRTYLPSAQVLYDWLVRPYADELRKQGVETIAIIPDGPLRSLPFAALHDGKAFLAERYALAVTPTFRLIDPKPLEAGKARMLIAGASDFSQFPMKQFADIGERPIDLKEVPEEVRELHELMGGTLLLNDDFDESRLEQEMTQLQPTIVHIASHAAFNGASDESYLLTQRGKITIDRLSSLVETTKFREEPLELLTLSACETAAGDDRAALGLAGVAISAGARSAVGSLWNIADAATRELILDFYGRLKNDDVSKAEALRQAQVALLGGEQFSHPYYWSPFLVINNWL